MLTVEPPEMLIPAPSPVAVLPESVLELTVIDPPLRFRAGPPLLRNLLELTVIEVLALLKRNPPAALFEKVLDPTVSVVVLLVRTAPLVPPVLRSKTLFVIELLLSTQRRFIADP